MNITREHYTRTLYVTVMAAEQRDFTDFKSFPGAIDSGTGYHSLPVLWHKDSMDRLRSWQIHVRMIKKGDPLSGIDWNLLEEKQIPIKPIYYNMGQKIASTNIAEAWVENGIEGGKITRGSPTYFYTPLNKGKANERNVFQNALIYARAQWLKRKDKGNVEDKDSLEDNEDNEDTSDDTSNNVMYFPMLAKNFVDGEKHLEWPLYVQPKLDGDRCLAYLLRKNGGWKNVILYTRQKKPAPNADYIKKILYHYLNSLYDEENNQSIYLDGEVYKHGKKLQDISGDFRSSSADTSDDNKSRNEYHVFDCFYPLEMETPYHERLEQLKVFYDALDEKGRVVIKEVPAYLVQNIDEANAKYKEFTSRGYEGAMLRNKDGPYLSSVSLRSKNLVKLKPTFSEEFEVVGYTEGSRGKDKGAIIWICQTEDEKEFNVTPKNITYEERYELFKQAEEDFDGLFKSRMMTVEYQDKSKTGVPQRAKAVAFRDFE